MFLLLLLLIETWNAANKWNLAFPHSPWRNDTKTTAKKIKFLLSIQWSRKQSCVAVATSTNCVCGFDY